MTAEDYINMTHTALNGGEVEKAQVLATLALARATLTVGTRIQQGKAQ